jgi:hypothetical protein
VSEEQPEAGPVGVPCAECGTLLDEGSGIALATLYVDDDGHEIDADLLFCDEAHRDAWIDRTHPVATAREGGAPLWRGAGQSRTAGYLGCLALIVVALALFLLVAFLIGRLRG